MYRDPTGPENECMVYSALINGVRGNKVFCPDAGTAWNFGVKCASWVKKVKHTDTRALFTVNSAHGVHHNGQKSTWLAKHTMGNRTS